MITTTHFTVIEKLNTSYFCLYQFFSNKQLHLVTFPKPTRKYTIIYLLATIWICVLFLIIQSSSYNGME